MSTRKKLGVKLNKKSLILIGFVLIFALSGAFLIFNSKAATTDSTANVWVATNGSDTGSNCKRFATASANPDPTGASLCKTLNSAWAKTTDGDVVRVLAGNYPAQIVSGDKTIETKIIAENGTKFAGSATCKNEYGSDGAFCANAKNMTLENVTLDGGTNAGVSSGSQINATNVTYKNVNLYGDYVNITVNGAYFSWIGGSHGQDGIDGAKRRCDQPAGEPVWIWASNVTIDGIRFNPKKIQAGVAGPSCGTDNTPHLEMIRLESGASNFTLKNSWFVDGSDVGSGHIFTSVSAPGVKLINNVFGTLNGTYNIQAASSACDWTFLYNTFLQGVSLGCTSSAIVVGNLAYQQIACNANNRKNVWQGTNNGTACNGNDKTFSNLGIGTAGQLSSTSPAIDAAETDSASDYCTGTLVGARDRLGTTRPQGAACDAGAFEYQNAAPTGPTANLWVDPNGGTCTRQASATTYNDAAACGSLSAAYNAASPNDLVIIKSGTYGSQTILRRTALDSGTCVSSGNFNGCIKFEPETGGTVNLGSISFGNNYANVGPSNISIDATKGSITTSGLDFMQANQIYLKNLKVPGNLYMTGGSYITMIGGEYGPYSDGSGTHPEIQAVYNSNPVIKPTHIKFSGGYWHDYNTTNATAHVDCLQIESGSDFTLENSRFNNCGSVGVRVSYGTNRNSEAPDGLLIQNNVFDKCADIPVSQCYYSAELGNGNNVTIRNNTFLMAQQPTTGNGAPTNVTYVGNTGLLDGCQTFGTNITYKNNVWKGGTCNASDINTTNLFMNADGSLQSNSPAIGKADQTNYPAYDILGTARPQGGSADAGAYEYTGTSTPPTCSTKPGDTNGDNVVNILDISAILSNYGKTGTTLCSDVTKDGSINIQDISLVLSKYGT